MSLIGECKNLVNGLAVANLVESKVILTSFVYLPTSNIMIIYIIL